MKKEVRLLLEKAVDSLIISIEHFNCPSDRGRVSATLVLLDHAFEMLLKAAIIERGGRIRERRAPQTIGFDACVRKALSDAQIEFLTKEQALQLQAINGLRDAAQHHLLDISEQHFYIQAQGGLTLFRDIMLRVFNKDLKTELPERVLPISAIPPTDLVTVFDNDVKEIRKLLRSGKRRKVEATVKLRSLAIVDGAMCGERIQPGRGQLVSLTRAIANGKQWDEIFPGVASVNMAATGDGPTLSLRITKKQGIPIHLVPEGTQGASVVAVKRVNELGYYKFGRDQVAQRVNLTGPKTTAMVWHLNLKSDPEYFKEIKIGASRFSRYSDKAVQAIKDALKDTNIDEVWQAYINRLRNKRKSERR